jgi:hypothetical protein
MELDAAVEYHDYYAQSVDRALGQPRGYGDLRMNAVNEIASLRGKVKLTCRDCGAEGPLIGGLCAGCSDAAEDEREGCVCGQGFNPECNAHHDTAKCAACELGLPPKQELAANDAAIIPQPTWADVFDTYVWAAQAGQKHPHETEKMLRRAADAHCKLLHLIKDPEGFLAMSTANSPISATPPKGKP